MLMLLAIFLLVVPLIFQLIFGYQSLKEHPRLPLLAVCIISIFSQVVLTFVSFALFIYAMTNNNEKCLSSSVGIFAVSFFISILLVVVISIQTILKVLGDKKRKTIAHKQRSKTSARIDKTELIELFKEAIKTKNADKISSAVSKIVSVDNPNDFVPYLCEILEFTWHFEHEDITRTLQELGNPISITILHKTATRKFDYLEYDDSKSLSRKCTWALADIGTTEAKEALIDLSKNEDEAIAAFAKKRIENWDKELNRKKH